MCSKVIRGWYVLDLLYLNVITILSVSVVVTLREKPSTMMNEDDCILYKPVRFNEIEVVRHILSHGDVILNVPF